MIKLLEDENYILLRFKQEKRGWSKIFYRQVEVTFNLLRTKSEIVKKKNIINIEYIIYSTLLVRIYIVNYRGLILKENNYEL